jgi:hypothetical protein
MAVGDKPLGEQLAELLPENTSSGYQHRGVIDLLTVRIYALKEVTAGNST